MKHFKWGSKLQNFGNPSIRVFWDVALCHLVVVDRRFRGAYCLHHQGDDDRALIMEVVSTPETSVYTNESTWR
jgi:hypothetical protein